MSEIKIYNKQDLAELLSEGDARISFHNEVFVDHYRQGEGYLCFEKSMGTNIMPTEGLNTLLDTAIGAATQITAWYVGIFDTNYTPLSTNTAANSLGAGGFYGECLGTDYAIAGGSTSNRAPYTVVAASGGVLTNAASKAEFTMGITTTVYGAFLTNGQAKVTNAGYKLLAAKLFDSARAVVSTDILYITYQITAVSS